MKATSCYFSSSLVVELISVSSLFGGSGAFFVFPIVSPPRDRRSRMHSDRACQTVIDGGSSIGFKIRLDEEVESIADGFLEDGNGHINAELAQRLFRWEREHQININVRPQFSTRDGLRWVKELVNRLGTAISSKSDLIQEGVIELMQAMTNYEHKARPTQSFEAFAKNRIYRRLVDYEVKNKLAESTNSRRRALSVESTVEIVDPNERRYSNQDEWEAEEGLLLDHGRRFVRDAFVGDFFDENLQYEGEDLMWVHQKQTAAPLRDSIPEREEDSSSLGFSIVAGESYISLDDATLHDLILHNVDKFLDSILNDLESEIIQLRFGLGSDEPKAVSEIAFDLGITTNKVRKLQKQALEKLRNAYATEYIDESDSHDQWEDSV